ncbi:aspartic peptidase domain-containing protein [Dactylonectria macrodidyma]|uniref:Aspartic peptidase domain-containing protein n=1 Tax=Dactylonectria macrodidyma TaxID=307937 RepID=A0A9P9FEY1_9HYPO|nr:aspartic peptidase domain-containing protein [Dactylonectria macrodidyma]
MRSAVLLAHLALWASSTHAFFPYTPKWREEAEAEKRSQLSGDRRSIGGNGAGVRFDIKQRTAQPSRSGSERISERASREAARLETKYARRHPADSLAKRDNVYEVMEADDTDGEFSAGVDQDGTDYSYFVEVEIGSKKKTMYMLIDTGAGSSWVMSADCKSEACALHNTLGPDDSDSLDTSSEAFTIAYGSGKVSGLLAKDTFNLAGMSFEYQFGLATNTSDQFVQFAFDGILGLSLNTGANENFLDTVAASNDIDKNIFCIALNRAEDGSNKGEISFGSVNKAKYTGDITYTSLNDGDDWVITLDDMSYDGTGAGVGGIPSYIDTGTSFMFGPGESVKALHALIPGAESSDDTTWTVPCDSDKNLTIAFSGVEYVISPKDWISPKSSSGVCTSNVYGHEVVKGAWLLGDAFIKNVYAIFDKDSRRIGFANSAITQGSSSEETSSISSQATKTKTSTQASSTYSTHVSALPDTSASAEADLGLGKETVATDTATADETKSTSTSQDSSAAGLPSQAPYAFTFCIVTLFALLA